MPCPDPPHLCAFLLSGVLVLEEYEHAKARGATILAEFVGGAFTCDAHHMTEPEPNGKGVILCIERALESAGVAPEEVGRAGRKAAGMPGQAGSGLSKRGAVPGSRPRLPSPA